MKDYLGHEMSRTEVRRYVMTVIFDAVGLAFSWTIYALALYGLLKLIGP